MKIYTVTLKKGNEFRTTHCDFRPKENETFLINGEKWVAVSWIQKGV